MFRIFFKANLYLLNNTAVAKTLLVQGGVDPNIKGELGFPLEIAVKQNHLEGVKLLLEHGANPNEKVSMNLYNPQSNSKQKLVPIWTLAAIPPKLELLKLMLKKSITNWQDENDNNILILALKYWQKNIQQNKEFDKEEFAEMFKLLLDNGVQFEATNNKGATAVSFAQALKNTTLLKLMNNKKKEDEENAKSITTKIS